MGNMQAMGMAGAVAEGMADLDAALVWHLRCNHYPPIPLCMLQLAKDAINAMNEDEPGRFFPLPDGVMHRTGATEVNAYHIVESLHLQHFLGLGEEDAWEEDAWEEEDAVFMAV